MDKKIFVLLFAILFSLIYLNAYNEKDKRNGEYFYGHYIEGFEDNDFIGNAGILVEKNQVTVTGSSGSFRYINKETGKEIKFENLKKDSKFLFENGRLVEANFEGSQDSNLEFNSLNYQLLKDKNFYYKDKKVIEGSFVTGQDGEYPLREDIVKLPKGTLVEIKDDQISVEYPDKTKIELPKSLEGKTSENVYNFKSKDGKGVTISGDDGKDHLFDDINWDKNGFFFEIKTGYNFKMDGADLTLREDGLVVKFEKDNPFGLIIEDHDHLAFKLPLGKDDKLYINFKGNSVKSSGGYSFSINEKEKTVTIASNNEKSNYIYIENQRSSNTADSKAPYIEIRNDVETNQDYMGFKPILKNGEVYLSFDKPLFNDAGAVKSSGTVDMKVVFFQEDSNEIKNIGNKEGQILGISNRGEMAFGDNSIFIPMLNKPYEGYPELYAGVSDSEIYNYMLTPEGYEMLTGTKLIAEGSKSKELISNPEFIRHLFDMYFTRDNSRAVKHKEYHFFDSRLVNANKGYIGQAFDSTIYFSLHPYNRDGESIASWLWSHERGHLSLYLNPGASSQWYDSGLAQRMRVTPYARQEGQIDEAYPEFLNKIFRNEQGLKNFFGQEWYKDKDYLASFSFAWYNGDITYERVSKIFSEVGIPYGKDDLYKYMRSAGMQLR